VYLSSAKSAKSLLKRLFRLLACSNSDYRIHYSGRQQNKAWNQVIFVMLLASQVEHRERNAEHRDRYFRKN